MAKIMNPDQVQKDFFKVIKEINKLFEEAEQNCESAAAGFNEGFYSGECNVYSNVINILDKIN